MPEEQSKAAEDRELVRAQTRHHDWQAKRLEHDLAREAARDADRWYHFNAPIVDQTIDVCMSVLSVWVHESDRPITLAFDSPGGHIFSGLALHDFIAEMVAKGAHIETSAYGFAASMAGICLQAGAERTIRPNAYFMVHEASTEMAGNMSGLTDQVTLLKRMQERTQKILVDKSGGKTTMKLLKTKTARKSWWLDAAEALAQGFVDRIVYPS